MTSGTPAPSGAWIDLVASPPADRALVSATVGDAALLRLGDRVADLAVLEGSSPERARLAALLAGVRARVEVGPPATVAPAGASFDLVVATAEDGGDLEGLARLVHPEGRLVLLTDNPVSPLRALDRMTGHRGGPTTGGLGHLRRRLAASGLSSTAVFALLRSSSEPTTAFRLDLPQIADTVLRATAAPSRGLRRWAIDALRVAARRGVAGHLVSAWLIVARRRPSGLEEEDPTGRIAVSANEQGVVLLGPGPAAVEKHFTDVAKLEATVGALTVLAEAGVDVGTRVIARLSDHWLQLTWVRGRDLDAHGLRIEELTGWLEQAASVLGTMQRVTLDGAGEVLVHGDFWLGAIVVEGDRISGIIDWTDAHRGDPRTDLRSLVRVVATRTDLHPEQRRQILLAVQRAHEQAGGPPAARAGLADLLAP